MEFKNLLLTLVLCALVLFGWQMYMDAQLADEKQAAKLEQQQQASRPVPQKPGTVNEAVSAAPAEETAEVEAPRIPIRGEAVHGSLSTRGVRFDDLTLAKFKETIDPESPEVVLLSEEGKKNITNTSYFAEFGWLAEDKSIRVPGPDTVWTAEQQELTSEQPLVLVWDNGAGLIFRKTVAVDEHYMFTITQSVENTTGKEVVLYPYGLVNHGFVPHRMTVVHEGGLGVMDGTLTEVTYKDLDEEKNQSFPDATGWLGLTDHYWLTAIVPPKEQPYLANFHSYLKNGERRYQADFRGDAVTIPASGSAEATTLFFAGAKELKVLNAYSENLDLPLFDRAVDFGVLYLLTRPLFEVLTALYHYIGNFGIAILILTVLVKLLLYPLANKSYHAMSAMKALQPDMERLRERHKDDKMKLNQELMDLYRKEKVNPMAGCLPLLIQIPVFFALYKVLNVSIEMRHAPFYGWIQDLSAPDPTNIFTLFGLLEWSPPAMLHIGLWPIIMCITMIIQQKLNPKPTDPIQEKVLNLLPYIFLFLFATFPAGLIIYWAWNNTLSIIQQSIITRRYEAKKKRQKEYFHHSKPAK
jgi:YidC/Oxa1 family membrane protein insertase